MSLSEYIIHTCIQLVLKLVWIWEDDKQSSEYLIFSVVHVDHAGSARS